MFVDECHSTGFFGKTGRGTEEFFGLDGKVDIINSTLGKALGGAAGGYTVASKQIVELLRQRSRPYLFSNSLPPPVVGSASKVMLALECILLHSKPEGVCPDSGYTVKCIRFNKYVKLLRIKGVFHDYERCIVCSKNFGERRKV